MTSPPPRVSICVPNLNTRRYLRARFESIFDQTFRDWELLVYDSYSDDGSWEYIASCAAREPRMRAWQGPRQGTPGSWTPCVRQARGEYVYVATSDDTMPPDCLEKLVSALERQPQCDVAHCPLRPIDEDGHEIAAVAEWWRRESAFALSSGELLAHTHVRVAPFDGLLHLLGGSVYISITQLLIRRSLFDRIGYFHRTWGSVGDFNWSMRAGLAASTVHVPDTWGGWRVHGNQATAAVGFGSREHAGAIDDMIEDALSACRHLLSPAWRQRVDALAAEASGLREFTRDVASRRHANVLARRAFLARRLLAGSGPAREYVRDRLRARPPTAWLRDRVRAIQPDPLLVPATLVAAPAPSTVSHPSIGRVP